MKRPKILLLSSVVIFAFIIIFIIFRAFSSYGEFSKLTYVFDGECVNETNITGAEDLAYDKINKQLFTASHNNIAFADNEMAHGHIYSIPIDNIYNKTPMAIDNGEIGKPLGIDINKDILAIINYTPDSKIEIYKIEGLGKIRHLKTVNIENLYRLDDITLIDENHFYFTNESEKPKDSFSDSLAKLLLNDDSGSIWFYENGKIRKVADGFRYANSVAISPDKTKLYASDTIGRTIKIYQVNPDFSLKQIDEVFLGTGPNNISIDDNGTLFIATHPKMMTQYARLKGFDTSPPSQVIAIEPNPNGKGGKIDQVYLKTGKDYYMAATSAIKIGDKLIMGSFYEKSLNVCTLPKEWRQSITHPAQTLIDTERGNEKKIQQLKEKAAH